MPKEMVRSATESPYRVKVGWHHAGGVQVGVEAEGERSLFWELLGSSPEALQKLGAAARSLPVDADDEAFGRHVLNMLDVASNGGYAGVWSDLDRQGCNDLIRLTRKARDTAFGKDE